MTISTAIILMINCLLESKLQFQYNIAVSLAISLLTPSGGLLPYSLTALKPLHIAGVILLSPDFTAMPAGRQVGILLWQ